MLKKLSAEFTGSFFIIFFGFTSIINNFYNQTIGNFIIALSFGVSTLIAVYLFQKISKALFNPALSFSFFLTGEINLKEFLLYSLSQFLGSLCAMILLAFLFSKNINLTLPVVNGQIAGNSDLGNASIIIIVEFISAFLLTFAYMLKKDKNKFLIIGFVVFLSSLVFFNVDGIGLNPIRVLIPSIFTLKFTNTFFYITGIFLGSISGGLLSHRFFYKIKKNRR